MKEKCVQIIPNQSNILYPYKSDLGALETIIESDIENNKKPLIIFARAGMILFYFYAYYYHVFYIIVYFS